MQFAEKWDGLGRALRSDVVRALAQKDPQTHSLLSLLAAKPAVHDALDELERSADARQELGHDPQAFWAKRGIDLPGSKVVFRGAKPMMEPDDVWFVGIVDGNGLEWGYEGGGAGRGFLCGAPYI